MFKISVNSRVHSTSEIAGIFNTCDEIYVVFTEKKAKVKCTDYFVNKITAEKNIF